MLCSQNRVMLHKYLMQGRGTLFHCGTRTRGVAESTGVSEEYHILSVSKGYILCLLVLCGQTVDSYFLSLSLDDKPNFKGRKTGINLQPPLYSPRILNLVVGLTNMGTRKHVAHVG
jgi:hypothetical protein